MSIPHFEDNQGTVAPASVASKRSAQASVLASAEHRLARRETPAAIASPLTNRGVRNSHNQELPAENDVVFSVDYLNLTCYTGFDHNIKPLLDYLGLWDGLEDSGHGGTGFERLIYGKFGLQVYADPRQLANVPDGNGQKTKDYFSLRFPGQCIQAVGMDRFISFLELLLECGIKFKPTRLDLAFDTQLIQTTEVEAAYHAGEVDCRARDFQPIADYVRGKFVGQTLYFGSRKSPALLRIYYKVDGHSFGDQPFTRFELELKDEQAQIALHLLFATHISEWAQAAGAMLLGFFKLSSEGALGAAWALFTEGVSAAWTVITKAPSTLAKMNKWVSRAVAPTLACVLMANTGGDVDEMWREFKELVTGGIDRMGANKKALAADSGADVPYIVRQLGSLQVEF